jgi:glycerate 2-kinase
MNGRDLRAVATALQQAALAAVEPAAAVHRYVQREGDVLIVADRRYDLRDYERVFVVGGGKAAVPMATAVADTLANRLTAGAIVTKYGHGKTQQHKPQSTVGSIEAGHPVPDGNSVRGAQAVADIARQATERDLVICLLSGGGSALLTLPVPGLTLADLQVAPAALVTLVLSDVVGDPLDVIASGPTVPDPTTVADAQAVLKRYGIRTGRAVPFQETPKPGDPAFERVQHVIVGSNRLAAVAAVEQARQLGFGALLLSTYVEGEAREVARVAAALAKGMRGHGDPLSPPACLVWGGETTVTIRGEGKGGRNQELALATALALDGWPGVLVMALATDGTDGPTDAAGAIATGETVARAQALGLDPQAALDANDSYPFFEALGDLILTGPTGTNVNDLLFVLVEGTTAD